MTAAFPLTMAALDRAGEAGVQMPFWWRDDDAVAPTPALDALLDQHARSGLPLALAVIPAPAETGLAARLEAAGDDVAVLQHGFAHRQHQPAGEKKAELGDHRPSSAILGELDEGRQRLQTLFGQRLRPDLVPPWNRIGAAARAGAASVGLPILSVFGPARGPTEVNTHVDIIDWTKRRGHPPEIVDRLLAAEIDRRVQDHAGSGRPEPLGLLTHHLVHDGVASGVLKGLLPRLAVHPAVRWPSIDLLVAPMLADAATY